ncbi:MAG: hypothetical protein V3T17_03365 [Pseudomonadales bacterium]
MNRESVVYGCIKDMLVSHSAEEMRRHRQNNREVMMSLPSIEDWPLLSREMFSMPVQVMDVDEVHADVVHFGTSYKAVEYEWQEWIKKFENMLKNMYWVSATVHLETAFNGHHTFIWQAEESFHEPNDGELAVRCEWSRESAGF